MNVPHLLAHMAFGFVYWQWLDISWVHYPFADAVIKVQVLLFGLYIIYRRCRCVIRSHRAYVFVYHFPFKSVFRIDELSAIELDQRCIVIRMHCGRTLTRHYMFSVPSRIDKAMQEHRLLLGKDRLFSF